MGIRSSIFIRTPTKQLPRNEPGAELLILIQEKIRYPALIGVGNLY